MRADHQFRMWPTEGRPAPTHRQASAICLFLSILAALVLAACGSPPAATTPESTPALTMTASPAPSASPTPSPDSQPDPTAQEAAPTLVPLPAPSEEDWTRGPADAPVSLVVYSDYQCPACQSLAPILKALYERHPDQVQIVYRHFPLMPIHDKASLAGQAAEAAGAQGRFWEMHDLLFERAAEWWDLEQDAFRAWLHQQAEGLDLDVPAFEAAIDSGTYADDMEAAFSQGIASGIPGTPFLFMNGDLLRITPSAQNLEAMTRLLILREKQYDEYPPTVIQPGLDYQAHVRLPEGEVLIELFPEIAPAGVNSFVYLAQEGWYDGTPVFRVEPGRRVDFGDPSGTGHGDAGYHFASEADAQLTFGQPGVVALSSTGPSISGSQFFITLAPMPELNGSRTIIGRVIRGLNLLQRLEARDPATDLLEPPQARIISLEIEAQ